MGLYVIDSKEYSNSKSSLTKEMLINLNECVNDNNNDLLVSLKKAMATHSSTLTWKIPWTEEPGRLQSMGSLRVRHD